jgi:hypothetical protein
MNKFICEQIAINDNDRIETAYRKKNATQCTDAGNVGSYILGASKSKRHRGSRAIRIPGRCAAYLVSCGWQGYEDRRTPKLCTATIWKRVERRSELGCRRMEQQCSDRGRRWGALHILLCMEKRGIGSGRYEPGLSIDAPKFIVEVK